MNLGANALGDEGLESVLGWAKKDLGTVKVLLQGNDIKVSRALTFEYDWSSIDGSA
jgi:hypothetical protein